MASTQAEIAVLLDNWSNAVGAKDIDRLMSLYASDIVYFDLVPPLEHNGAAAVRRNFLRWFGLWKSGIGSENRELTVSAGGDVAAAFMLHRTSGTLKDGQEVDYWVRVTIACRRTEERWLITHEHVSLPVDLQAGRVVMDLTP